jgi:hypothetical protein
MQTQMSSCSCGSVCVMTSDYLLLLSLYSCLVLGVTTLILNEYRQSSNSSVSSFQVQDSRRLRMPIARYCLSVELV